MKLHRPVIEFDSRSIFIWCNKEIWANTKINPHIRLQGMRLEILPHEYHFPDCAPP